MRKECALVHISQDWVERGDINLWLAQLFPTQLLTRNFVKLNILKRETCKTEGKQEEERNEFSNLQVLIFFVQYLFGKPFSSGSTLQDIVSRLDIEQALESAPSVSSSLLSQRGNGIWALFAIKALPSPFPIHNICHLKHTKKRINPWSFNFLSTITTTLLVY